MAYIAAKGLTPMVLPAKSLMVFAWEFPGRAPLSLVGLAT